jgi:hypothetical protein
MEPLEEAKCQAALEFKKGATYHRMPERYHVAVHGHVKESRWDLEQMSRMFMKRASFTATCVRMEPITAMSCTMNRLNQYIGKIQLARLPMNVVRGGIFI